VKSVITCDLEGRIETFGKDAEAVFGWSADEVIGKKRVSLFSPGETVLEHVPSWLSNAVKNGAHETNSVFLRKDGAEFPAHIRISPTFKNGAQIGYCGVTEPLPMSELERARPKISFATKAFRWLVVTRAPFLTASLVPVLVGAALAPSFAALPFVLALIGALALHVAANTWNDLFDWRSGADQANNDYFLPFSGGSRAIELGLITERGLATIAWCALLVATLCGALLTALVTPWVLAYGAVGAFAAYFYTAPPLRLVARRGLGELFIGACFGPLMTGGVYTAMTGTFSSTSLSVALWVGVPVGLLTTAILWINEIPDAKSDATVGKNHLVVTLGHDAARWGYLALMLGAYGTLAALIATQLVTVWAAAAFIALPFTVRALVVLFKHVHDRALVGANKMTIYQHLVFGLALAAALAFG
jgi:1,4-dihydroxy-2-naphthoate octaprenyltransferase